MADVEYKRLGCAVEACAGLHKARGYCLRHLRQWQRGGIKEDATCCGHCGSPMTGKIAGSMYCSRACKQNAWRSANPDRYAELRRRDQPTMCAYWAGYCTGCMAPLGGIRKRAMCQSCADAKLKEISREAHRAAAEAVFKAAARVVVCKGCDLQFCPLYDYRPGPKERLACPVCKPALRREMQQAAKSKRDERIRATTRETVYPSRVFSRDGWHCRICGIETPKHLRGTYEHNAPELDHIVPLARGGAHTYANTQCACRSCNGWKGARTMDEVDTALSA